MAIHKGLFTLNTTNPRFYTLCGTTHVKLALIIIIIVFGILELSEWITYITVENVGETTDWLEALISLNQLIMLVCMILAAISERAFLLVPFILFMILSISIMGIWVLKVISFVFIPYSEQVEMLFEFDKEDTFMRRENTILTLLAVLVLTTTIFSWCLQVGFLCYQYFESRQNERKTKAANMGRPLPNLVNPNHEQNEDVKKEAPMSFGNKNFTISDDDEDDDRVFEKQSPSDLV